MDMNCLLSSHGDLTGREEGLRLPREESLGCALWFWQTGQTKTSQHCFQPQNPGPEIYRYGKVNSSPPSPQ